MRDPESGKKVINKVYRREEIYSGKYVKDAPDLLIGYNRGYRTSWESALGKVPEGLFGDNMKKWSGTHLWDYELVPGIILSNKKIKTVSPALYDIAPTILAEFGIKKNSVTAETGSTMLLEMDYKYTVTSLECGVEFEDLWPLIRDHDAAVQDPDEWASFLFHCPDCRLHNAFDDLGLKLRSDHRSGSVSSHTSRVQTRVAFADGLVVL